MLLNGMIAVGLLLQLSVSAAALNAAKRLVVFGDSYSDNGNLYALTQGQYPNSVAYYQGRFTNGPVWAEYLATLMQLNPHNPHQFLDFAYSQAKVLKPTSIVVYGKTNTQYAIPSFADEINTYTHQYTTFRKNDVVVVFMATNDFFDISPMDPHAHDFFIKVADTEAAQINRLTRLGARHIIVLNGRDVTRAPLAQIQAQTYAGASSVYLVKMKSLIQAYNQELSQKLKSNKSVMVYDLFAFDERVIPQVGNVKMCYHNPQGDYQHVAGPICQNAAHYFYYDRIHTTRAINALLAQNVLIKTRYFAIMPQESS